jgi:hypothetical protein
MGDFEFLAGFFGVLLGLIIAEVAGKLAEAIDHHEEHPIGVLTPLLAGFVLCDATSFWLWIWAQRQTLTVSWPSVFACSAVGIAYYLTASLIFPRSIDRWRDLDAHYWARKRWVIGGLLGVNTVLMAAQLAKALPEFSDVWFFIIQGAYYVPLVLLMFSRRRWLDVLLLVWMLIYFAIVGFDLAPGSEWANRVDLNPRHNTPAVNHP